MASFFVKNAKHGYDLVSISYNKESFLIRGFYLENGPVDGMNQIAADNLTQNMTTYGSNSYLAYQNNNYRLQSELKLDKGIYAQRKNWDYEAKIALAKRRIEEWDVHWDSQVYLSFSGFINSDGFEDETEFDAFNMEELKMLYRDFCRENGFRQNTVLYVER